MSRDNAWLIGVLVFLVGILCASIQSGISKFLTAEFPVALIVWWRFFLIFLFCAPLTLMSPDSSVTRPPSFRLQIFRGFLLLVGSLSFVAATKNMPLADAVSILFVYPFLMTVIGARFLGERVGIVGWIAVAAGFVGVVIVMRPGGEGISPYSLLALLAGVCFAAVLTISRVISSVSPVAVTATWTAGTATMLLMPWILLVWVTPSLTQFWTLLLLGLFSVGSQLAVTFACKKTDMGILAPFGYAEIVSATVIGFFMFRDVPDVVAWLGISIIIGSGLLIALVKNRNGASPR